MRLLCLVLLLLCLVLLLCLLLLLCMVLVLGRRVRLRCTSRRRR